MTVSGSHRVVIAGGGFAALEATIALRRLAGGRVEMILVSPERELAYPPLSVVEPFGLGEAPRFDLAAIARDHQVELHVDAAADVDTDRRILRTHSDGEISYDSLLVTTGADQHEAVPGALTFRGSRDRPAFEDLLADIDAGRVGSVAFAVPAGTAWPLPLYELALMTAARAEAKDAPTRFTLVTSESAPLGIFGGRASEAVGSLLQERGIELHTSTVPVAVENGSLLVAPSGSLAADRVVALPQLRGRSPAGLPHDAHGFLTTDEHGQVRGCADVFAAGDVTAFPVKQGGIATQQADAAARSIAARAGSPVEKEPFRPVLRGLLLTGEGARFMRSQIAGGQATSRTSAHACSGGRRRRWRDSTCRTISPAALSQSSRSSRCRPTEFQSRSTSRTPKARHDHGAQQPSRPRTTIFGRRVGMTTAMRATVFEGKNRIAIQERPVPPCGPTDAIVRVTLTTICGTDVHIWREEYPVEQGGSSATSLSE